MRKQTLFAVLVLGFFVLSISGCGGSSGGSINPPPVSPSITVQPGNQTVTEGQPATFNVTASGTSPLNYQWQKNGVNIAGATSPSFTTQPTVIADNGAQFKVTVSNSAGSVTSSAALLTVNPAPVAPAITTQPANQTVNLGQPANFTVAATGTAPLSYQWRKNGTAISGATASSFTTPPTVAGDNGSRFSVVVSNPVGSVTSAEASLTVVLPNPVPTITSIIPNSLVAGGGAFTLTVNGTNFFSINSPLLPVVNSVVNWNGSPRNTVFVSATQLTASITAADIAAAGSNAVTVVNPAPGGGTSNAVNFTVTPAQAPTISFTSATMATVAFGASQQFQLRIGGSPPPVVTCPGSGVVSSSVSGDIVTYSISNTQPASYQATMSCTATNSAGSATTNPPLTINLVGQILGATDRRFYCGFAPCFDQTVINLTGAFGDTLFKSTCSSGTVQIIDSTHVREIFGFGSAAKPQFCDWWITEPSPGGGDSNHITFGYGGSQPYSVVSSTEDIQLDQASGNIYRIKLGDGSLDGSFNLNPGHIGIAFDDQSGLILVGNGASIGVFTQSGSGVESINTNTGVWSSVAAQGGFGCAAEPGTKQLTIFDIPGLPLITVTTVSVPGEPWNVQMTKLPNNQLACIVQTINPAGIAVYAVPSGQQLGFMNAVGAASAPTQVGSQSDNWQLTVTTAGNGNKVAAALFKKDNASNTLSLFLFDLVVMSQLGNGVDLSGDPLRLGSDNANHRVVVAMADFLASPPVTRFVAVDLSGNVTQLTPTVPFLVTSLPFPYVSGSDKNFAHPF